MKLIASCFKISSIFLQVILKYHHVIAHPQSYNHRESTRQQLREVESNKSHGTERELWIRTTRCGQRYPTSEEEKMKKEVLEKWSYDHPCDEGKSMNPLCPKEESSRFESSFKISPIRIQIHLHMIKHANGAGHVTHARIRSFIDVLNEAYKPRFVFHMKLAQDITYTTNTNWYFGRDVEAMQNKLKRGDCNDLNIYTIKPTNELMGWAAYPWECRKNPMNDGVVIYHETLPGGNHAPFNLGMTLVHEVGHWLGLLHTFEGGCDGMGDFIPDTPAEKFPSFGCPIGRDTCPGDGTDPVTNYMDYSDDSCMTHFTQGQIKEMLASYDAYRVPEPTPSPTRHPTPPPTPRPTRRPTKNPTRRPTKNPTRHPTKNPTRSPTKRPTSSPTKKPTPRPTRSPTRRPTKNPTLSPTKRPTSSPTKNPTPRPTRSPTLRPTTNPTRRPTSSPTPRPTKRPTVSPTPSPSIIPSLAHSVFPSIIPTTNPSLSPTLEPTGKPSILPTLAHSLIPSAAPTMVPSLLPTDRPSISPTLAHSLIPSAAPTMVPSILPTDRPSISPTFAHSLIPSTTPTMVPSTLPTDRPSLSPTLAHSQIPSDGPSLSPTLAHSQIPSAAPTTIPSLLPSDRPSISPTLAHSLKPTSTPTMIPTRIPSLLPSLSPTLAHSVLPSAAPTMIPSLLPSDGPSISPTLAHSLIPTSAPTMIPTIIPSLLPSDEPSLSPTLAHSVLPTSTPAMIPTRIPSLLPSDGPSLSPTLAHSLIPTSASSIQATMVPTFACNEFKLNITTPEYLSDFFFWRLENRCDREILFKGITFDRQHHINVSKCLPSTGYELIISGLGRDFFDSEDSEYHLKYNKTVIELTSSDNGARATFGSCENPAYNPNLWTIIFANDFEEPYDYGNFTSSGSNAKRYQGQFAHSGEGALYLRDGKVERRVHFRSDNINVTEYSKVKVSFWYYTLGMQGRDGFSLQYSLDRGASWVDQMRLLTKKHFENGVWNEQVEVMGVKRVNQIMIRFRGRTDSKSDKLLIDDVVVSAKLKDPSNSKTPEEVPDGLQWVLLFFNDFENPKDWGMFRYDGPDARRSVGKYSHSGEASIFLRDGFKKTASIVTSPIDISTYDMLRVKFWYYPWHMEGMDGFLLEYSIDRGESWVEVKHWKISHDFQNDEWYEEKEYILIEELNSIMIRFRCFSNTKRDKVYFDDIEFSATNFIQTDSI